MNDRHVLRSAALTAVVSADGAELQKLTTTDGVDLLWHGGPEWPRFAPVLFPIVGRLVDDTLVHQGRPYRLTQHGFARDHCFTPIEHGDARIVLELTDDAATRAVYPFAFRLDMTFEIEGKTLTVGTTVENPGDAVLPCGVGAHPAFRWPLIDGVAQEAHSLEFSDVEPPVTFVVRDGLLGEPIPAPLDGRTLRLSPGLFVDDAVILADLASRSVRFSAHGDDGRVRRSIEVAWTGYKDLGIWSKPKGAAFLCIEPWYGMCSPIGWQGEITDKPGILLIEPGGSRRFSWSVTVV